MVYGCWTARNPSRDRYSTETLVRASLCEFRTVAEAHVVDNGSGDGDARQVRLQPTTSAARIISPGLLPNGYVPLLPTARVVRHGEAGVVLATDPQAVPSEALAPLAAFETVALWQAFAPSALVASLAEDELVNEHGDEIITVLVMPLGAIPAAMADALRKQPIAGPIPTSVPDETRHHRSLKQIRQDFVVQVTGDFTKEEILRFTERVDLDVDNVNLLLGRNKPGDSR